MTSGLGPAATTNAQPHYKPGPRAGLFFRRDEEFSLLMSQEEAPGRLLGLLRSDIDRQVERAAILWPV